MYPLRVLFGLWFRFIAICQHPPNLSVNYERAYLRGLSLKGFGDEVYGSTRLGPRPSYSHFEDWSAQKRG